MRTTLPITAVALVLAAAWAGAQQATPQTPAAPAPTITISTTAMAPIDLASNQGRASTR